MKTTITLALCSALLLFSSCKKAFTDHSTDIAYAMKHGYLYNTWIIDDDNTGNHSTTQNSHTFANQKDPEIRIKRDNSNNLKYTSPNGATVNETGTCSVNADAKTVTFHPSGKSDYTYKISAFTEEVFTLVATYDKTVSTTTAEGVVTTQTIQVDETLFLEDND